MPRHVCVRKPRPIPTFGSWCRRFRRKCNSVLPLSRMTYINFRIPQSAPRIQIFALICLTLTGCLGPLAKKSADRQVYPIISQKQAAVLGSARKFTIEPTTSALTRDLLTSATRSSDMLSTAGLTLSLSDALSLAINNNREYQRRKDRLYQSALALTSTRHDFSPIFTGLVTARATRQPGTAVDGPGVERFGEITSNFAVTKLFATGARVSVGLTNNLLRYYSGSPRETATGALSASVVQPLLQGGGYKVTLENLIQAERNVIYAVRDYARYQKSFTITRMNEYYRLLQLRDTTQNQYQSYQRLVLLRERAEAFLEAGRMPAYQVDQARQDEITAQNDWLSAKTDYALALDQFKLNLGIPPELAIQPDPEELAKLRRTGVVELEKNLDAAQNLALKQRLDLMTARDTAEDEFRRIDVVKNSLLPALDARFDYRLADSGHKQPLEFRARDRIYSSELALELPLDRLNERNAYRNQLIAYEQARRAADQARDQVVIDVRSAFQQVQEARTSYEIQARSRDLAAARIESVRMLLEAGWEDITVRDQLEANQALLRAENALTQQLVNYLIARLNFYNATESLDVDDRGSFVD